MVQVLVLQPGQGPQAMELDDARIEDDGARIVGGPLAFVRVTDGENAWGIYVVHDERAPYTGRPVVGVARHRGQPYRLHGTCFFTAIDRQGIRSLTDDEINHLRRKYI